MEGKVIGIHGPVLDLQFTDYTPFERELIKVRDIWWNAEHCWAKER